ncbi:MAG: hypothetical protein IK096_05895, partial [Lachnospiraceae bacterium]|nr:hypothetical protein [Lachnospiraceae bacterium]
PLLLAGMGIKAVYFARKDLLKPYMAGLWDGLRKIAAGRQERAGDAEREGLVRLIVEMFVNVIRRAVG